jgi:hypothetical protein
MGIVCYVTTTHRVRFKLHLLSEFLLLRDSKNEKEINSIATHTKDFCEMKMHQSRQISKDFFFGEIKIYRQ